MKSFQINAILEEKELHSKINELSGFINSKEFNDIDRLDKILMKIQLLYMNKYLRLLRKRIKGFDF